MNSEQTPIHPDSASRANNHHYFRFHKPHLHLSSTFGGDWFGLRAEKFARFFGTPTFLTIHIRELYMNS